MSEGSSAASSAAAITEFQAAHPELDVRVRHRASPQQRVVVWVVGSVLAALLPLAGGAFHGVDRASNLVFYDLFGRGELLIIAATIAIAGVADLSLALGRTRPTQAVWVALLVLGILLLVAAAALWYGDLTSELPSAHTLIASVEISWGSIAIFVVAAVLSSICVSIAAGVN